MTATFDQKRAIDDIEERITVIRRQAERVLQELEGHDLYTSLRPVLEGTVTNTSHILNDLDLLAATLRD
jgi:hypothetical protein